MKKRKYFHDNLISEPEKNSATIANLTKHFFPSSMLLQVIFSLKLCQSLELTLTIKGAVP